MRDKPCALLSTTCTGWADLGANGSNNGFQLLSSEAVVTIIDVEVAVSTDADSGKQRDLVARAVEQALSAIE